MSPDSDGWPESVALRAQEDVSLGIDAWQCARVYPDGVEFFCGWAVRGSEWQALPGRNAGFSDRTQDGRRSVGVAAADRGPS